MIAIILAISDKGEFKQVTGRGEKEADCKNTEKILLMGLSKNFNL